MLLKYLINLTLLTFTPLFAQEMLSAKNGKLLYDNAKCSRCHSDYIYKDVLERKMKTADDLQVRVERCAVSYADWFEEDTADVIHFLNTKYYKFK